MKRLLLIAGLMLAAAAVAVGEKPAVSKKPSGVVLTDSQAAHLSVYTPKPDAAPDKVIVRVPVTFWM